MNIDSLPYNLYFAVMLLVVVVGAWMARKAAQIRMPYIYFLPSLILMFVSAGFGFTLFAIVAEPA